MAGQPIQEQDWLPKVRRGVEALLGLIGKILEFSFPSVENPTLGRTHTQSSITHGPLGPYIPPDKFWRDVC